MCRIRGKKFWNGLPRSRQTTRSDSAIGTIRKFVQWPTTACRCFPVVNREGMRCDTFDELGQFKKPETKQFFDKFLAAFAQWVETAAKAPA